MGRGGARTLQYWVDKGYFGADAERMRMSRIPGTIEYFEIFKGLGSDDAIIAKQQYQAIRANTLDNMIARYGEEVGRVKWDDYRNKQADSNSFEYKKLKYGWTKAQWNDYNKKRGHVGETNPNFGTSYYERWVEKYGKLAADEMNAELSITKSESKARWYDDNPEFREWQREDYFTKCMNSGSWVGPMYNPKSIPIIETYGAENGYTFQHAENGGEFRVSGTRFYVDGYDSDNNVVIEYDERFHTYGKWVDKDNKRQEIITNILGCTFIRISEDGEVTIYESK